jgi:hypothetical protein
MRLGQGWRYTITQFSTEGYLIVATNKRSGHVELLLSTGAGVVEAYSGDSKITTLKQYYVVDWACLKSVTRARIRAFLTSKYPECDD